MSRPPAASRGGTWVTAQFALLGLFAVLAPMTRGDAPSLAVRVVAVALALSGACLALWAGVRLGPSFTPFPRPVSAGRLCREGPYRWVRHPIYAAVIVMALGWALWWQSLVAAMLVPVLFAFFAFKARAEERWLATAYPEYGEYAKRVKALVPFLY